MSEHTATIRAEIEIPQKLQDAAAALIALGTEFARHDGFQDFVVEENGPLNMTRAMRITLAINFATSVAASAAYDALKSNITSGSASPLSIVQNLTISPNISVTPAITIAPAGVKPIADPPLHNQGAAHHEHHKEHGCEHGQQVRHGQDRR